VSKTSTLARVDLGPRNVASYLGSTYPWHDEFVTSGLQPADSEPPGAAAIVPGAALTLIDVVCRVSASARGAAGVSMQVPPGQSVALLGRPASAAIELVDTIAGLRRPVSGLVSVGGVEVQRLRGQNLDRYRSVRGLLSMRFPLLESLSVTDNVLIPLRSRRADAVARARAARLLAFAGAEQVTAEAVESLSAEQRWRILIARALMPSPQLVLAEDPTRNLDADSAAAILDLLMEAHALFGFTLLLTVGRVGLASRCQRLVSVADGAVIEDVLIGPDDGWTRGRVDRIG
jgi:putative ABC transport system ATP-binding protein